MTARDEMSELLPCPNPWCVSTSRPVPAGSRSGALNMRGWRIMCACGVQTFRTETRAEAITAWNTRPSPARDEGAGTMGRGEEVEEIRTQLFKLCEHLEDEAYAKVVGEGGDLHEQGFWTGQRSTAKSIRRAMDEVFRDLAAPVSAPGMDREEEGVERPEPAMEGRGDPCPALPAGALRPGLDPLTAMLVEAVRFASWAAGEGICPVDGQPASAPEDFLMAYSDATGEEDWETMADRLPSILFMHKTFPKIVSAEVCFSLGWSAGYESALKGNEGLCLAEAFAASDIAQVLRAEPQDDPTRTPQVEGESSREEPIPSTPPFIQWNGGENPAPGKVVEAEERQGCKYDLEANKLRWSHKGWSNDIIAYRIIPTDDQGGEGT